MSIIFWFAVFFMWWWISLLAVLPWGVRTDADENSVQIGNAASAPHKPMLARKFIITTIIALSLTLSIRWLVEDSGYSLRPVLQMMGMKINTDQ